MVEKQNLFIFRYLLNTLVFFVFLILQLFRLNRDFSFCYFSDFSSLLLLLQFQPVVFLHRRNSKTCRKTSLHNQRLSTSFSASWLWWMTLSHRLQRSVHSLGLAQTRWINGCWECSDRGRGSIHRTSRRCWERNTGLSVWLFNLPECLFLRLRARVSSLYRCIPGNSDVPWSCDNNKLRPCWHRRKSKAFTNPNVWFSSNGVFRVRANHYLLYGLSATVAIWRFNQ